MKVSAEKLTSFMIEVFKKLGIPEKDAIICSEVLIESDLRGIESHGIGRLKMYYDRIKQGIQNPETKIDVIRDKFATAVWDGNHGMGHVIGFHAMNKAIEKASQFGIGAVAVRNSTHYGICGFYASMAIDKDMIGLTFTNARPSIAPLFGVTPMLGTNPICFGCPSDCDFPFLYDAATSISQRGKIEQLARERKNTPKGWAIDTNGNYVIDSIELLKKLIDQSASLVAIGGKSEESGGHKGYGLSTIVEILSASLQQGSFMMDLTGPENGEIQPYKLGHFFLAINIDFFTEVVLFKKSVGSILRGLKSSKLAYHHDHIYVAGEKEYLNKIRIREEGVEIGQELEKNLNIIALELDLPLIHSSFATEKLKK